MSRKKHLELIDKLAQQSGYYKYQINDIIHSLAVVVAKELQKGNDLYIEGIGTLTRTQHKERLFISGLTGTRTLQKPKDSARIRIDKYLSNAINTKEDECIIDQL